MPSLFKDLQYMIDISQGRGTDTHAWMMWWTWEELQKGKGENIVNNIVKNAGNLNDGATTYSNSGI